MERIADALERLCPIGSGATTCSAGREADGGQGGVDEERSDREDRRVPPGEAEAAIRYAIELLDGEIERTTRERDSWNPMRFIKVRDSVSRLIADMMAHKMALMSLLPEPDSKLAEQASGRRNADGDGRLKPAPPRQ
jgi:hypothetical protein